MVSSQLLNTPQKESAPARSSGTYASISSRLDCAYVISGGAGRETSTATPEPTGCARRGPTTGCGRQGTTTLLFGEEGGDIVLGTWAR